MIVRNVMHPRISHFDYRILLSIMVLCLSGAYFSKELAPTNLHQVNGASLEQGIPQSFGNWHALGNGTGNPMLNVGGDSTDQPYDQVLYRNYRNEITGKVLSLAIAWGGNQRQEIKIHRPELCYAAQGFQIQSKRPVAFGIAFSDRSAKTIPGTTMVAASPSTSNRQVVAYWIRIGSLFSESAVETRIHLIAEGLAGRIPDGVLVRVSMVAADPNEDASAYTTLSGFMSELIPALPLELQRLTIGSGT